MTAPQGHITGRVRAEAARYPSPPVPPGWTINQWRAYLDDPDGGRSPVRAHLLPPFEHRTIFDVECDREDH